MVSPVPMLRRILKKLMSSSPELLPVGSAAPAFEVPDHEGNTVRLSDFAGRRLVLWFYPKASTPG